MAKVRMKRLITGMALLMVGGLSGCAMARWQIQPSQYAWGEQSEHLVQGSLLLDTQTGDTWLLSNDGVDYQWKPIVRTPHAADPTIP